jgi:hypothetical protein
MLKQRRQLKILLPLSFNLSSFAQVEKIGHRLLKPLVLQTVLSTEEWFDVVFIMGDVVFIEVTGGTTNSVWSYHASKLT